MGRLFNSQSPFWRAMAKLTDVLGLSAAWLLLSLPVFTVGASTAALYDAAVKCVLGGENGPLLRFCATFKREFKTGALAALLWGGLCALLVWGVWALRANVAFEGAAAVIVTALWFIVLLVPVGALCWMFPALSRFTFSPVSLGPVSLRLALGFLPRTILVVAAALAGLMLSVWLVFPAFFLPCLVAIVWAKLMEGVFARYTPQG